jgi:hypothetical protein
VLTGAGVSVDSGVKAYRGKDGRYMNPDYKCVRAVPHHICPSSLTHIARYGTGLAFQADFRGHSSSCNAPRAPLLTVM